MLSTFWEWSVPVVALVPFMLMHNLFGSLALYPAEGLASALEASLCLVLNTFAYNHCYHWNELSINRTYWFLVTRSNVCWLTEQNGLWLDGQATISTS